MKPNPWLTPQVFGGVLAGALLAAMIVTGISQRDPNLLGPNGFFFGQTGAIASVASLLAVVGAFAAWRSLHQNEMRDREIQRLAAQNLELNIQAERTSRFQKAVELVANSAQAAKIGGTAVLVNVALEDPQVFAGPAIRTLRELVSESNPKGRASIGEASRFLPDLERTDPTALEALHRISQLRVAGNTGPQRLLIANCYLVNITVEGYEPWGSWNRCRFKGMVLHRVQVSRCDFRDSVLDITIGDSVCFSDCRFTDARLTLFNPAIGLVRGPAPDIVSFEEQSVADGFYINGLTYEDWLRGDPIPDTPWP